MNKKAQLSIFVIIGVVLILLLVLFFSWQTKINVETTKPVTGAEPVRIAIETCVIELSEKAVYYFGMFGGRIAPEAFQNYLTFDEKYRIPEYYVKGVSYMPSREDAEKIMAKYVEQNLDSCSDTAKFQGMQVTKKQAKAIVSIQPETIVFKIIQPVTVQIAEKQIDLDQEYSALVKGRMHSMLEFADKIITLAVQDDLLIHWDYMTDITEKDYNITAYPAHDESIIYRIIDLQNNLFKTIPYTLQFAVKVKTEEP